VLMLNFLYGLNLVVIHAILLGSNDPAPAAPGRLLQAQYQGGAAQGAAAGGYSGGAAGGAAGGANPNDKYAGHSHQWLMQLMDLDIGFGHELMGNDDWHCIVFGLLYGIVVVVTTGYMFQQVSSGGTDLPKTSRWFVAFMNFEIVLYIGLVLVKLPKLCKIQNKHLSRLEMDCDLLRFLFLERAFILCLLGGAGCWIFSSLAYFLAFGFQAIDRPEFAEHLDIHDSAHEGQGGTMPGMQRYVGQVDRFMHRLPPGQVQSQQSRGSLQQPPSQSFRQPVGGPVGGSVYPSGGSRAGTASRMMGSQMGGGQMGSAYAPQSYHIPRATSSMVTTATAHSQAETQPFIKGPVAMF